ATSTAGAGICTLSAALVPEQPDTARMIAIRIPVLIVRLIASSFVVDVKCNAFANAKSLNLVRNAPPSDWPPAALGTTGGLGSGRVNSGSRIRRRVVRGELLCRGSARSV